MGLFHRKSKWEQLADPVARVIPGAAKAVAPVAKSTLSGIGVLIGMSAASAAVSAVRERKSRE
jgi:hypothetical protein